jgi:hypothetical protein
MNCRPVAMPAIRGQAAGQSQPFLTRIDAGIDAVVDRAFNPTQFIQE